MHTKISMMTRKQQKELYSRALKAEREGSGERDKSKEHLARKLEPINYAKINHERKMAAMRKRIWG